MKRELTGIAFKAKQLRDDLKAAFPGTKFWVTSKGSINVSWIDGPTTRAVEAIADQYENVSRCEYSGEILSGGNTFVFCRRLYSRTVLQNALCAVEAKKYSVWTHIDWKAIEIKSNWDDRGFEIVNKREYTVFDGYRRDLIDDVYEILKEMDLVNRFVKTETKASATAQIEIEPSGKTDTVEAKVSEKAQEILEIRAARFNERKERKLDRYNELAQKHKSLSNAAYEQSSKMASVIPFGQPILVGHHSEKRDRRYRSKIRNKMGQSVKHSETANYYTRKVESIEKNNAIHSDDPEAIQNLKKKIAELESLQESMKAANKIVKSKKLSNEEKLERLKVSGYSAELLTPDCCGRIGYPDFSLTNNNANIRRLRERLIELEKSLIVAAELGDTEQEYSQHGLKVIHARSINRLQLLFNGKPSADVRTILKSNGFRWAPSEMAWQRFLTNSEYSLKRVIQTLDELTALVTV